MKNPRLNAEGYADPTAYNGLKGTIREEQVADKKAYDLMKVLKYVIRAAGFELVERIQVKDVKSGRVYK
ncbi:MAG: hypothetical protein R3Y47_02070 [Lachnospiraceae bacterium]